MVRERPHPLMETTASRSEKSRGAGPAGGSVGLQPGSPPALCRQAGKGGPLGSAGQPTWVPTLSLQVTSTLCPALSRRPSSILDLACSESHFRLSGHRAHLLRVSWIRMTNGTLGSKFAVSRAAATPRVPLPLGGQGLLQTLSPLGTGEL